MRIRTASLLLASLALVANAFGHADVELGPNGGRLVELGKDNAVHAEFVLKGDQFIVGLYDEKARKEVPVTDQALTVIHKEGNAKLTPELKDGKWTIAKPAGDDFWLILQLREKPGAKPQNGRLHYDAAKCGECKEPEWLCKCASEADKPK